MKVLFLPDGSKINPYQKELAKELEKQGVTVMLGRSAGRFPLLNAIRATGKQNILHLHWTHGFIIGSTALKTMLKGLRFLAELIVLKIKGVKIIWTIHNLVEHERRYSKLELFFQRIAVIFYDHLIVHSLYAQRTVLETYRLSSKFKSKISIIPHGNYIDSYENRISREEARDKLLSKGERLFFLYFGQIRPYKGVFKLIETFQKINHSNICLFIVGKPINEAVKDKLCKLIYPNSKIYTVLNFVPDNEIQIYMNAADVIILPYRDILTSGAVILAMSFGKPIIAPAIGCIPDVLDNKGSFLYDPLNKEALLKAMKQTLNANLKKMGKHNIELAKQFQWGKIAKKTHEVYSECLNRKR